MPRRGGDSPEVEATFEAVETSRIPARAGRGRQQDASADQLQLHAGSRGAGHLGEAGVDDVGRAGQGTRAEPGLLATHPFQLVLGYAPEHRRRTLRHGGDDDEVAQALEQVSTATLTTVLLKKGLRNVWMRGTRPLSTATRRVVGRAFTLRFVPAREDLATPESWSSPISTRAAIEAMPAGCIAVVDALATSGT